MIYSDLDLDLQKIHHGTLLSGTMELQYILNLMNDYAVQLLVTDRLGSIGLPIPLFCPWVDLS